MTPEIGIAMLVGWAITSCLFGIWALWYMIFKCSKCPHCGKDW